MNSFVGVMCGLVEVTVEVNPNVATSSASAGGLIQTTEGKRSTRIATQTRSDSTLCEEDEYTNGSVEPLLSGQCGS